MTAITVVRPIVLAILVSILNCVSVCAAETYQADLSPMPLDAALRANIQGRGMATASLDGTTLKISGSFGGLTSAATEAHVYLSPDIGVPSTVQIIRVTASPGITGTLSGDAVLSTRQAAALRAGKLYVVISSQNAPSGNLWGWLLPAHDVVGPDVPQHDEWFQPHIGAPLRWSNNDPMAQR